MIAAPSPTKLQRSLILPIMPAMPAVQEARRLRPARGKWRSNGLLERDDCHAFEVPRRSP